MNKIFIDDQETASHNFQVTIRSSINKCNNKNKSTDAVHEERNA